MSKKVLITESQYGSLFEARMDGFRVDALRDMTFKDKIAYCRKWLGNDIGKGSARMVFQMDDETVLKLAINKKGLAQNQEEYSLSKDGYIGHFFPKVYNGSDEENFLWIVSEYVLPAKKEDFQKILGIPWNNFREWVFATIVEANTRQNSSTTNFYHDKYQDNDELCELISDLEDYIYSYNAATFDLTRISSWGLTRHNELRLLDFGLNSEIYDKYYNRY